MLNVNIWVIFIAGALNMVLGMLWYGPLFGKAWMVGMGIAPDDSRKMEDMQKTAGSGYAYSLLFAFIFGYVLDLFLNLVYVPSLGVALILTAVVYLGFGIANTVKSVLWGETNKQVFMINTGFEIVFIGIMTVVAFYL